MSEPATAAPTGRERPLRILLVDDEPDLLVSYTRLLETALPVTVRTARSGPAALRLLGTARFDVVMTDYKMPGMNGLEFVRAARALAPGVPFYLITAYASDHLEGLAEAMGVERFVSKGEDPHRIEALLRQDLGLAWAR